MKESPQNSQRVGNFREFKQKKKIFCEQKSIPTSDINNKMNFIWSSIISVTEGNIHMSHRF